MEIMTVAEFYSAIGSGKLKRGAVGKEILIINKKTDKIAGCIKILEPPKEFRIEKVYRLEKRGDDTDVRAYDL